MLHKNLVTQRPIKLTLDLYSRGERVKLTMYKDVLLSDRKGKISQKVTTEFGLFKSIQVNSNNQVLHADSCLSPASPCTFNIQRTQISHKIPHSGQNSVLSAKGCVLFIFCYLYQTSSCFVTCNMQGYKYQSYK